MTTATDVVITGFGVISGFGFGAEPLLEGVFAGRPAFRSVDRFDTEPYRCRVAAAAPRVPGAGGGEAPRQLEAFLACADAAAEMAGGLGDAPVLVGTAGDYTDVSGFWRAKVRGHGPVPVPTRSLAGDLPQQVGDARMLGHPRIAFTNACVASANAVMHGCRLIAAGRADTVLCGGAYLVEEELFAKFDSGHALSRTDRIRPFSADRDGLLLGDGVAALVLESAGSARARGAEPLARVAGWGMAGDAHHVVHPHPEGRGMATAIRDALRRSRRAPEDIGYVNAHGTGTPLNDRAETAALRLALGSYAEAVPVSSTKSTTGHTLEASGALEVVITLLALRHRTLPPTAGYTSRDPACALDVIPNQGRPTDARAALTLNASFGGLNTALLLEAR